MIVTVNEHGAAPIDMQVTVVVPIGKTDPDNGRHEGAPHPPVTIGDG